MYSNNRYTRLESSLSKSRPWVGSFSGRKKMVKYFVTNVTLMTAIWNFNEILHQQMPYVLQMALSLADGVKGCFMTDFNNLLE